MKKKQLLTDLIDRAKTIGLAEQEVIRAREYLEYNEYGLCFDTVITQLYEFNIGIDRDFYLLVSKAAKELTIPLDAYSFMEKLINI